MYKTLIKTAILIILIALVSACGPTTTSMPPKTTVVHPTSTIAPSPVSPTAPTAPAPAATTLPLESTGLIAFYSERDGNTEIYTMRPDGSDPLRLTFNEYDDYSPDWSPDGSRIVFLSDREDPNPMVCFPQCLYQLYVINADGSDEHKLVTTDFAVLHPDWHPAGDRLSFDTEFNLQGDIYVVQADGTGLQLLIEDGFWADWSPDGTQIAFASNRDGNVEIYVADADGRNQRRLTENTSLEFFPAWSPDGRRIAFAVMEEKQIFVVNADGSDARQLTVQGSCEGPTWSPDGSQIAFQSSSDGDFEIYTVNVEEALQGEGSVQQLTDNRAGDFWPSWGPVDIPNPVSIHFEKSEQTFPAVPTYQIGLADLDGDGDLDAVFSNGQTNDSQVWLNDGMGYFTDSGQALGKYGHGVNVGDLDGDGDLDLLINTHQPSAPSRVYLNDGQAVFQELEGAFEVNIGFNVHLFDIDGDGDLDAAGEGADAANVYWNDGTGAFKVSETAFPLTTIWGDLDGDGDVDVLVKENEVGYAVHLNDGLGHFTPHWQHTDGAAMDQGDMALGDVDDDGDLDAVITNGFFRTTSHPAMIFINDGMGQFSDSGQRLSTVTNAGVDLGDLDGDGDLDLLLTDYMQPCQVWLNDGAGRFTDSGFRFGNDQFYRHVHLSDLDGDGDMDIFLATFGQYQGPNEIWFNTTVLPTATPQPTATQPTVVPTPAATAAPEPTPYPALDARVDLRTYGGQLTDWGYDILLLDDGSTLIVGQVDNAGPSHRISPGKAHLIRTDAEGAVIWEKDYGGEVDAMFYCPIQSGDDEYVILGQIAGSYTRDEEDIYLVKIDGEGNEIWSQIYGGRGMGHGKMVRQTADGGFILAGGRADEFPSGGLYQSDLVLIKTDAEGSEVWTRTYGEEILYAGWGVAQTPDGGYILIGWEAKTIPDRDVIAIKTDAVGEVEWSHTWDLDPGDRDGGFDMILTADGHVVIAGIQSMDDGPRGAVLIKVDLEGNEVWVKDFTAGHGYEFWDIMEDQDGGYVMAGGRFLSPFDPLTGEAVREGLVIKTDPDGEVLWQYTVNSSEFESTLLSSAVVLPGRGYIFVGAARPTGEAYWDMLWLKLITDGTTVPLPDTVLPPTGTNTPAREAISVDTADKVERLATLSGHDDKVNDLAFSGDGTYLASSSLDKTIQLWDVENWQPVHTFRMNKAGFNGLAFSPDGRLLASADAIWDVESRQVVHVLEQGRNDPGPVAFSPDGSLLAVALEGRPIKLWDVTSGEVLRTFAEQPDTVTFSIAFSPDGALLAAGVHGGMVRLWDVARGQVVGTLDHGGASDDVHDLAFSPDGSVLASAGNDNTVHLWDVASGQSVHTLRHGDGLYGVAFSPDGSLVASACCDRTVKLWDVKSGSMLRSLPHDDEVMAVAFSPDGTLLASGGYDNLVYLWGIASSEEVKQDEHDR